MSIPTLTSDSRLMLIAPHPDDEALACSSILQRAVRAGAAVRVVYATDGDDNPWPQRVLERKWRLSATDRKHWAKLRRAEALAALRVLGVLASSARFLALPDQGLTDLLTRDCRSTLERFAAIIGEWAPTHLLVPSSADTHPDHNALAVMLRLVLLEFFQNDRQMYVGSYAVHGKSAAFFNRAQELPQSETETLTKLVAIRCHKTQIKLSRRRFVGYAARPERLLKLDACEATPADGSVCAIWRQLHLLRVKLRFSVKRARAKQPAVFILGHDVTAALRCLTMRLPARSSRLEISDCVTHRQIGIAQYCGDAFAADLAVPIDIFSTAHPIFLKLERRSWFFDEAGWLEIPASIRPQDIALPKPSAIEQPLLAIRER